ncbi:hypothetical protein K2173_023977 [Erythroxylum novogranatense]|uniref:RNase H type-1 domain-containing protein n=1 Tax=Erythroxylum novogranatense TaxID=1862640 RepID=A0AAV8TPT3_9ROSI|nr:hypothetical protein K2173_023977 [Erythroxylum novogranatense]
MDGSFVGNPGTAGFRGLLRDDRSRWLVGFFGYIGHTTSLLAELLALQHGMALAWQRGFRQLIVESDSQDVIRLVANPCLSSHPCLHVRDAIRTLLLHEWTCTIVHAFREGNRCTDLFAKHGATNRRRWSLWPEPLPCLCTPLTLDASAWAFPRP